MDIRIEKTDRAIEKAFLELRSKMPLEKIEDQRPVRTGLREQIDVLCPL